MTEAELVGLSDPGSCPAFDERDRVVLEYALAMTITPVHVDDDLFARLRQNFAPIQVVELTAAIAWENYRARFNHALEMESEGFSEGALCPIPARSDAAARAAAL